MTNRLRELWSDTSGGTLVEYALVLVLIAIVSFVAIKYLGTQTANSLNSSAHSL